MGHLLNGVNDNIFCMHHQELPFSRNSKDNSGYLGFKRRKENTINYDLFGYTQPLFDSTQCYLQTPDFGQHEKARDSIGVNWGFFYLGAIQTLTYVFSLFI